MDLPTLLRQIQAEPPPPGDDSVPIPPPRELSSSETYTMRQEHGASINRVWQATPRSMRSRPKSAQTAIAATLIHLTDLGAPGVDGAAAWLASRIKRYSRSEMGRRWTMSLWKWLDEREYENDSETWDRGGEDASERLYADQVKRDAARRAEYASIDEWHRREKAAGRNPNPKWECGKASET